MNIVTSSESDFITSGKFNLHGGLCLPSVKGEGISLEQRLCILKSAISWLERRIGKHIEKHVESISCKLVISKRINARAMPTGEIVILSGLIDLFFWYTTFTTVTYILADVNIGVSKAKNTIEHHILQIICFELLPFFHGVDIGILLKLNSLLSKEDKINAQEQLYAAIAFVICHEIGHIALGHFDEDAPISSDVPTILEITETLSPLSNLEIAADSFAISGVLNQFESSIFRSTEVLFTTLAISEAINNKYSQDHPFTLNRLATLRNNISTGNQSEMELNDKYIRQLASLHREFNSLRNNNAFGIISNPEWLISFCNESLLEWGKIIS